MPRLSDLLNRIDPRARSWHPKLIRDLATTLTVDSYLEIGIYRCETLRLVAKVAQNVVGVDIDEEALRSAPKSANIRTFLGSATDFAKANAHEKFDLIFIDANHAKEHVISDFNAVEQLLTERGMILLHDTWPATEAFSQPAFCGDAFLAVHELREERPDFDFVTIFTHPGLTLCQRTGVFPEWYERD